MPQPQQPLAQLQQSSQQPNLQQVEQQTQQMDRVEEPVEVVSSSDANALEAKAQARSERKRSREKQRRSDVNKQFADLTLLLKRINEEESKESEEDSEATKLFLSSFKPSNQADLIAHTTSLLERFHNANKRRKKEVKKLEKDLEDARKAGEETAARLKEALLPPPAASGGKMMMVPMMVPNDGQAPMMMPQFMQQPFCQMGVPAQPGMFMPQGGTQQMAYSYPTAQTTTNGQQANTTTMTQNNMAPTMMMQFPQMPVQVPSYGGNATGGVPMPAPVQSQMQNPTAIPAQPTTTPKTTEQGLQQSTNNNIAHCA